MFTDIWTYLKSTDRPIILYGTGNGADKIYAELERLGIKVRGVFASDGFVRERYYKGFKVLSLAEAEKEFDDFIALFCFGSSRSEVLENIKHILKRHTLLAPEVPVYGKEIFNIDFVRKHQKELEQVYSLLCDDISRNVFEQTVLFKLDGNINRLFACETDVDESFDNILKLSPKTSFLDLGAYNGDTVLDFANRVPDFSHISAVEPDAKNFKKLCNNTSHLNINAVNAAVSSYCGTAHFSTKSSRGSSIGSGLTSIPCINVDSLNPETPFNYIKFDVEGAESEAILGAKQTILDSKPKMKIACYHRSEDYYQIPLEVFAIRDDYKLYMRHFPGVPAWDTDFYFV